MGITDRRYMSDSNESFGSIRGHEISAVLLLIVINVAVWLMWQFAFHSRELAAFMSDQFMCSPSGVWTQWRFHTLLTTAFSHQDATHIIFNMLGLFFLGPDLEYYYGRMNFVALYIVAALAGSLAQLGLEHFLGQDVPILGASGAVMGIVVAAAFVDPQKPMRLFGVIPMKLWILAALIVGLDVSGVVHPTDNTGHAAHLGGALAGLLFYVFDLRIFASRGRSSSGLLYRFKQWWRARKFRVIERRRGIPESQSRLPDTTIPDEGELVAARRARVAKAAMNEGRPKPLSSESARIDPETARRVDELLAKISRDGMDALSPDEREFLKRSSEKYRKQ